MSVEKFPSMSEESAREEANIIGSPQHHTILDFLPPMPSLRKPSHKLILLASVALTDSGPEMRVNETRRVCVLLEDATREAAVLDGECLFINMSK